MADYIKREDALEIHVSYGLIEDGILYVPFREVIKHLKNIPAANVMINTNDISYTTNTKDAPSLFECKKCGWESWDTIPCDHFVYCPGCGRKILEQADMRGGEKDG